MADHVYVAPQVTGMCANDANPQCNAIGQRQLCKNGGSWVDLHHCQDGKTDSYLKGQEDVNMSTWKSGPCPGRSLHVPIPIQNRTHRSSVLIGRASYAKGREDGIQFRNLDAGVTWLGLWVLLAVHLSARCAIIMDLLRRSRCIKFD